MDKVMRGIAVVLMIIGVGIVMASVEAVAGAPMLIVIGIGLFGMALCYAAYQMFLVWGGEDFLDSPFGKADWRW